jgi:hypothetical protein
LEVLVVDFKDSIKYILQKQCVTIRTGLNWVRTVSIFGMFALNVWVSVEWMSGYYSLLSGDSYNVSYTLNFLKELRNITALRSSKAVPRPLC